MQAESKFRFVNADQIYLIIQKITSVGQFCEIVCFGFIKTVVSTRVKEKTNKQNQQLQQKYELIHQA